MANTDYIPITPGAQGLQGVQGNSLPNIKQVAILKQASNTNSNIITISDTLLDLNMCFDGTNIWIAGGVKIWRINITTNVVTGFTTVNSNNYGICFDGTNIWYSDYFFATLTAINPITGSVVHTTTVGTSFVVQLQSICFDGHYIWCVDYNSKTIIKVDTTNGTIIGSYNVGGGMSASGGVLFDGNSIWICSGPHLSNYITKMDLSGNIVGQYPICASLSKLGQASSLAFDGTYIWASGGIGASSFGYSKLNPADGAIVAVYPATTDQTHAINRTVFDGRYIWRVTGVGSVIEKIDIVTSSVVFTHSFSPNYVFGICFDGTYVWSASCNTAENQIYVQKF